MPVYKLAKAYDKNTPNLQQQMLRDVEKAIRMAVFSGDLPAELTYGERSWAMTVTRPAKKEKRSESQLSKAPRQAPQQHPKRRKREVTPAKNCKQRVFKVLPSADYLRERLSYDEKTGVLVWKSKPGDDAWNARWANTRAGYVDSYGDLILTVDHAKLKAHRVAYALLHGDFDAHIIVEIIDDDKTNLRASNLRIKHGDLSTAR